MSATQAKWGSLKPKKSVSRPKKAANQGREARRNYSQIAKQYAKDVVSGAIPACGYIKIACREHLSDLENEKDPSFPYRYDRRKGDRVCAYIELYPHIKGEWSIRKPGKSNLLILSQWTIFMTCRLFGMVDKITGLRRFTEFYGEIPRKNAKTTWAAAVGHYLAFADGEPGAEVYCGASTEKQAMEVFGTARLQVMRSPDAQAGLGIEIAAKSLYRETADDYSKMIPVVGDPGDGSSPSAAILDELHEHNSSALRDAMLTGMGSRRQPLLIQITTAGVDMAGVCYAVRTNAVEVLKATSEGRRLKDSLFAMIYTLDPGDDPLTEASLRKANPNYGVSVYAAFLNRKIRDAINNAAEYFITCTKHLNLWGNAKNGYFNMAAWARSGDAPKLATWHGKPCYEGLDLAARVDLASRVKIFTELRAGGTHYYLYGTHYVPLDTANDGRHMDYAKWVREGHLTGHGGAEIQLARIQGDIRDDLSYFDYQCLAFDQAFALQMQQELEQQTKPGVVITIPQTARMLSDGMKELAAALVAGRVHHTGDPVLTWCMGNVVSRADKNENEFPDKERPENKIDAATALLNAMNRVMAARLAPSVYETGEGLRYL